MSLETLHTLLPSRMHPRLGALLLLILVSSAGCRSLNLQDQVIGPSYQPTNYFLHTNALPATCRRVALLPIAADPSTPELAFGQTTLEPVLLGELLKAQRFEVVSVTPDQMRRWSTRPFWATHQTLPPDLLKIIQTNTGCDAVLFCELTHFKPYQPLAIGWRATLVQASDPITWWAIDELFESGNPLVANAARRFYKASQTPPSPLADSKFILTSPRQFAAYTAHALFTTLP